MRFRNHIAYEFLTNWQVQKRCLNNVFPGAYEQVQKIFSNTKEYPNPTEQERKYITMYDVISPDDGKVYYVTETVLDKLEMLKVKPKEGEYDWSVFGDFPKQKFTFLFPTKDGALRMVTQNKTIFFIHMMPGAQWTTFSVYDGKWQAMDGIDDTRITLFIYRLLCFVFLSENEYEIMKPGEKKGTKKNGKIINELPFPITIINSKWNITSIRLEGFLVSGHFALRWTGEGRQKAKMVFIQPYEKHGYVRHAQMETIKNH